MRAAVALPALLPAMVLAQPLPVDTAQAGAEADAFRDAAACRRAPGTDAAAVTVGFDLDARGRVAGEVVLLHAGQGVAGAFAAARRAVLRRAGGGYGLPAGPHRDWRRVEITFAAAAGGP